MLRDLVAGVHLDRLFLGVSVFVVVAVRSFLLAGLVVILVLVVVLVDGFRLVPLPGALPVFVMPFLV